MSVVLLVLLFLLLLVGGPLIMLQSVRRSLRCLRARPAGENTKNASGDVSCAGLARPLALGAMLDEPSSGVKCLWYSTVLEWRSGFHKNWEKVGEVAGNVPTVIEAGAVQASLELAGATTFLSRRRRKTERIGPRDAHYSAVLAACNVTHTPNGSFRVVREWIVEGDELFVVGAARLVAGMPVPHAFRQSPTSMLAIGDLLLSDAGRGGLLIKLFVHTMLGFGMTASALATLAWVLLHLR